MFPQSLIRKQAKAYEEKRKEIKQKIVVFDLDGTLCELKPELERNNHTGNEKAISFMYNIYLGFSGTKTIVLTGRKEKYREITKKWLNDNDLHVHEIIMQSKSTADKNHVFKREKLVELKDKYDIVCMFDDNPLVGDICKELGINFLQVNNYENTF